MKKRIIAGILGISLFSSFSVFAKEIPITSYEKEQGITNIETFDYQNGMSFGKIKSSKDFDKLYLKSDEYNDWNWANVQDAFYYIDNNKNLHTVFSEHTNNNIVDLTFDKNNNIINKKIIKTSLPIFAGFYRDKYGMMYLVSGEDNLKEDSEKTVVVIEKFNSNWNFEKKVEIKGKYTNLFEGISKPFDAGSCRISMYDKYLIIHTSREMFKNPNDGLNHQSNISFIIDTDTMTSITSDGLGLKTPYVSHSFNQFVVVDQAGNSYYLDHGDAYPRGIVITKYSGWTELSHLERFSNTEFDKELVILPISGRIGDNYTGCEINGFEIFNDKLVTLGKSINQESYDNKNIKNVFLNFTDTNLEQTNTVWITDFSNYKVDNVKLIKINDEKFVVLANVFEDINYKKQKILLFREYDINGNLLNALNYKNVSLLTNSQPIFDGKNIYYLGKTDYYSKIYLHKIPYIKDKAHKIKFSNKKLNLKKGKKYKIKINIEPSLSKKNIAYYSSNNKIAKIKNGIIYANRVGKVTITAKYGDKIDKCVVEIKK